jgi:Spy/CpxP family protein refolding chaperone
MLKKSILTLLSLLLVSGSLFARGGGKHGSKMMGGDGREMGFGMPMMEVALEEIGVSKEIRAKIREMMFDFKKEMIDFQKDYVTKRIALKDEIQKASFDEAKIKTLIKELAELRKEQMIKMEFKKLETMKLLSVEQRKKLYNLFQKNRKEHFKSGKGMGKHQNEELDD